VAELLEHFSKKDIKGEIVIVLEGKDGCTVSTNDDSED
jgi:16S rRNA C1402 (ribose-2'-O) methylase RsmI